MQQENIYRHGDLLIKRIEAMPDGLKPANEVLAEGETTGHKHRLLGQVQVFEDAKGGKFFQVLEQPAQLVHEEHKPITIEEGVYVVVNEREFDPFAEEMRKVAD